MGLFDIFKKKSPQNDPTPTAIYTDVTAVDGGDGVLTLRMVDPASGATAPFPQIDVLLRDAASVQQTANTLKNAGATAQDMPATWPVTDDVVQVMGLDQPNSYTIMSDAALRVEGLTRDIARTGALFRLRAAVPDLVIEGGGGRMRVTYPDTPDMAASFLLVTEDWLDLDALDGAPVFAVGTRISIHVCGANDAASLAGMREIASVMHVESVEDHHSNGKPLTPDLLTIVDGKITRFEG